VLVSVLSDADIWVHYVYYEIKSLVCQPHYSLNLQGKLFWALLNQDSYQRATFILSDFSALIKNWQHQRYCVTKPCYSLVAFHLNFLSSPLNLPFPLVRVQHLTLYAHEYVTGTKIQDFLLLSYSANRSPTTLTVL